MNFNASASSFSPSPSVSTSTPVKDKIKILNDLNFKVKSPTLSGHLPTLQEEVKSVPVKNQISFITKIKNQLDTFSSPSKTDSFDKKNSSSYPSKVFKNINASFLFSKKQTTETEEKTNSEKKGSILDSEKFDGSNVFLALDPNAADLTPDKEKPSVETTKEKVFKSIHTLSSQILSTLHRDSKVSTSSNKTNSSFLPSSFSYAAILQQKTMNLFNKKPIAKEEIIEPVKITVPDLETPEIASKRSKILEELKQTEKSYRAQLEQIEKYHKILENPETLSNLKVELSLKEKKQVIDLLKKFEGLAEVSSQLLNPIEKLDSQNHTDLIQAFLNTNFASFTEAPKYYKQYLELTKNPAILHALKKIDEALIEEHLTSSTDKNSASRPIAFNGLIIAPVQRGPRYEMLFKEILKNTPSSNTELTQLASQGLEKAHQIAVDANKSSLG